MDIIQLKSSIPSEWKEKLKQCTSLPQNIPSENLIKINNKIIMIEQSTCNPFYLQLINTNMHKPAAIQKWSNHYPEFNTAYSKVWKRIYKLSFNTIRDTTILTFQHRIVHKIIPWHKWLHIIKIKSSDTCDYCVDTDDVPHLSGCLTHTE